MTQLVPFWSGIFKNLNRKFLSSQKYFENKPPGFELWAGRLEISVEILTTNAKKKVKRWPLGIILRLIVWLRIYPEESAMDKQVKLIDP